MSNIETIIAIGGEGPVKIVVGGKVIYKNEDMRDKWEAHKNLGKSDFTLKTINEILALPEYIDDINLLREVLKKIWDAPIEKIYNGIVKSLDLDEPIIVARRTMFWKLKELIESIILVHIKYVQKLNVKQLVAKWTSNIKKNKVDTSSVILWTLFDKTNQSSNEYFPDFGFTYLGYCPYASNFRIKSLLEFPLDKLINDLKNVPELKLNMLEFKKLNQILLEQVGSIETPQEINKCVKKEINASEPSNYVHAFMEVWLDLNDCFKPFLEENEVHYIHIAKNMDDVSAELENINKQLITLI
jgi:hypothetical protein